MVDTLVECLHALCGRAWSTLLLVLCTETSIVGHPVSCYAARPESVVVLSDVVHRGLSKWSSYPELCAEACLIKQPAT